MSKRVQSKCINCGQTFYRSLVDTVFSEIDKNKSYLNKCLSCRALEPDPFDPKFLFKKQNQPPKKKYNYRQKTDGEGSAWIGVLLQIIIGLIVIGLLFYFNH